MSTDGGWGQVHQYRGVSTNKWASIVGIRISLSCDTKWNDASKVITGGKCHKD